ncbi:hypothetical protein ACVKU6_004529, partial [Stenotrophomonas sp. PvP086]|uniref:hypothetical protein n=1 Tax=Stenotrophomonas sp. PvP087 TaxID=3156434 RepID=UPI003D1DB78A
MVGTKSTAPTKVGIYQNRLPASGRHYPCNNRCIALVGANLGWHEIHSADQGRHLPKPVAGQR